MQKTKKKSLQELNLSDNFLFGEVMCDEETCKTALEVILGREIAGVAYANKEKHLDVDAIHKGIQEALQEALEEKQAEMQQAFEEQREESRIEGEQRKLI